MTNTANCGVDKPKRGVPIKEGLLTSPLSPLEQVRLQGSRCRSCGEVFLGIHKGCENCQGDDLESVVLSNRGKLYSYTVIRNRPPGNYVGSEPFVPFAVGLVELPEGLRILSPLTDCDIDALEIDTDLELVIGKFYEDQEGNEVIAFKFKPVQSK